MKTSETIAEFAKAFAAYQLEVENATKGRENSAFRSKYADLAEILNTVRECLAKHGICVLQDPAYEADHVFVETRMIHTSGEWVSGIVSLPVTKKDPQGVGSAITYGRRYGLAAMACISQEDDDANAATGKAPATAKFNTAPHIAAIEKSKTLDGLQETYKIGYKLAEQSGDREACAELIKAKDAKKAELQEVKA